MKKLLLILLCLPMIGFGQLTYVPDDNFEQALINLGHDIVLDDSVMTGELQMILTLNLSNQNIADLTGIEDCISLTNLDCRNNQLTSLDVSQNPALTYLDCWYNQLTSLDVSQNPALTMLSFGSNNLTSLDVSNNTALTTLGCGSNNLTSLDLSQNTSLTQLWCSVNQLTSLDVSNNTALTDLRCGNNLLTIFDVRNGNNTSILYFECVNNPNLTCINVDNATWSTANWTVWNVAIDAQHYFSTNCSGTVIEEQTTNKELLQTIDILRRETKGKKNEPLFYIYDDGIVEKRIIIE